MAFLTESEKTQTAQQIKSWYTSAISQIDSIKSLKAQLTTQLTYMSSNPDYSASDNSEVQALINDINTKIAGL